MLAPGAVADDGQQEGQAVDAGSDGRGRAEEAGDLAAVGPEGRRGGTEGEGRGEGEGEGQGEEETCGRHVEQVEAAGGHHAEPAQAELVAGERAEGELRGRRRRTKGGGVNALTKVERGGGRQL